MHDNTHNCDITNILITNSSGGLCFQSDKITKGDPLILTSLLNSLQAICKQIKSEKLHKTTFIFKTMRITIFSSIRNDFIFISKKYEISEKHFLKLYEGFIKEVIRQPNFSENAFIKSKKFNEIIEEIKRDF